MKKYWIPIIVIVIIIIAVVIFYKPAPKEVIKIGALYPLSGSSAAVGEQFLNGALLAVDIINRAGGVNGRKIELVIDDHQNDPKLGISELQQRISEGIKFFIGTNSRVMLSLIPIVKENKVVLFADSSHPDLTGQTKFTFRHAIIAEENAKIMVDVIKDKDISSVGILTFNDDYGLVFQKALVDLVFTHNQNTKISKDTYLPTDTDFKTIITKILQNKPGAIFIVGQGNAMGVLIKQIYELRFRGLLISDFGPVMTPDVLKIAGDAAKGMYYSKFKDISNEFVSTYEQKFNKEPGNLAFLGYGDIEILAAALGKSGEDTDKVSDYILNLKTFNGKYEKMDITSKGDILPPMVMDQVK